VRTQVAQVGAWNGKSIPTFYAGTTFRSRLEARWAVFFDHLGLRWFYEYEGFELADGSWYLPDFWLSQLGCFIEIKPIDSKEDLASVSDTFEEYDKRFLLFKGAPGEAVSKRQFGRRSHAVHGALIAPKVADSYCFCFCPCCGSLGIEFDGRADIMCRGDCYGFGNGPVYAGGDPRLLSACEAARVWRFH
jgi:hypothetical protein